MCALRFNAYLLWARYWVTWFIWVVLRKSHNNALEVFCYDTHFADEETEAC